MALIVVSNRLPVTIRHTADGITLAESVGGLATGLRGLQQGSGGAWIGWPGPTEDLTPDQRADIGRRLEALRFVPVHLSRADLRGYYQGYSNGVIWPLFHYLPQRVPLNPRSWDDYERVNRRVAEAVAGQAAPGDEVWIHDYQLMRVPLFLRRLRPDVRIGFFLHIPFPAYEVYRILPARRQLLEGMLGADLVGFHTTSYSEHFTSSVSRLLGIPVLEEGRLEYDGRTPMVGVFPMGIEVARFERPGGEGPFWAGRAGPAAPPTAKTLVGIDRLDYTKGIPRRLLAFERLLARYPDLHERVSLIQVAVPSRTGVKAYRRFRRHVDAMVGRINGTYGTPGWAPVQYLYRGFTQAELVALYRSADVMLVTPVRDGMNLVAKEFIASRIDADGVLVLSEFTGAAAELVEAVLVNPYDIDASAEAYHRALTMEPQERRARMRALRTRVRSTPVERWAESFLAALRAVPGPITVAADAPSPPEEVAAELARLRQAASLLLLLDYDGTLVSYAPTPELATPDRELLRLLHDLARRPRTRVHLVSGRQRAVLEAWFGEAGVGLHAEHGSWSRTPGEADWQRHDAVRPVPYDELLAVLKRYTEQTPGALIERKSAGLAWHFRLANPSVGRQHADALVEEVGQHFSRDSVDVLRGNKVVEFRPTGVHKGLIVTRLLDELGTPATTVAVGDDTTDEDMFAALPEGGLSVHVGSRSSGARLRLADVAACRAFLHGLLDGPS
jgi:trehalose 6-phosphate synthase/phosphatase